MAKKAKQPAKQPHDVAKRAETLRAIMLSAAEVQTGLDKSLNTISNSILKVAALYQDKNTILADHTGTRVEANSEKFRNACKAEEKYIRSKEAGSLQRDTLPKCWTQAKSNIKAALELCIDVSKYNSESKLRKEVVRVRGLNHDTEADKLLKEFNKQIKITTEADTIKVLKQALAELEVIRKAAAKPAKKKAPARKPAKKKAAKQPARKPSAKPRVAKPASAIGEPISDAQLAENLEQHLAQAS